MGDPWEYKMLKGDFWGRWKDADEATNYGGEITTEILNRLGQEGWEVCAMDCSIIRTLILKRKKP
jgi:Domain of unknown function (DUF4177)